MSDAIETLRAKLLKALAESDELRRPGRAERILWLSTRQVEYGAIVGPMDTMAVFQEARDCLVEAHYVAVLLLATAFIEHTLTDELREHRLADKVRTFYDAIRVARQNRVFPDDLLSRTDQLRLIRNPFAHRKPPGDPDNLPNRFLARQVHPTTILEEDAKESLELMYAFFRHTLKGA